MSASLRSWPQAVSPAMARASRAGVAIRLMFFMCSPWREKGQVPTRGSRRLAGHGERSMASAVAGGGSGSVTLLRGALVAALLREQGQLLVGGLLFLEGLEDQRQGLLVTKLLGQGGQG